MTLYQSTEIILVTLSKVRNNSNTRINSPNTKNIHFWGSCFGLLLALILAQKPRPEKIIMLSC